MSKTPFHIALPIKHPLNFSTVVIGSKWIASWACTRACKLVHHIAKFSKFSSVQLSIPNAINTGSWSSIQTPLARQLSPQLKPSHSKGKPDNFQSEN